MTHPVQDAAFTSDRQKIKKLSKKVTWSVQLETVKLLTPDVPSSKFRVFRVKEEDEDLGPSLTRKQFL